MTTKHNHAPNFGRRVADCPRCNELNQGAAPVKWSQQIKAEENARFRAALAAHNCRESRCMPICTFGDW